VSSKLLCAGIVAGLLSIASITRGAVIATYNFSSSTTAAANVDPNASASSISFGTSVNSPIFSNDFYISKPVLTVSRSNDTAAQVYLQATITAAPGFELNMDSFTFDGAKGGAATPRTYEVHSSVAGLLNDASTAPTSTSLTSGAFAATRGASGATDTLPTITTDLSSPAYDNLSSLTMRIYLFTPTVSQNIDLDNITFNGTVVATTTPEPASLSGALVFIGALVGRRRRV
jgi:hypothetical protein